MSCGTCYQAAAQQLGSATGTPGAMVVGAACVTPGGQIYGVTATGQTYTIRAMLSDNRLASLQRDAQRILGQIPAPHRDSIERYAAGGRGESEFLTEPTPDIRELAELWLSLRSGEAAEIWIEGVGVSYANVAPPAEREPTQTCATCGSEDLKARMYTTGDDMWYCSRHIGRAP